MAATIGKVAAVFTASSSGLTAGTRAAGSAMNALARDVAGLRSSMRTLTAISGAQLFGSIASAATNAARSFIGMGQAQAETVDKTSKLSARLGMTYGELAGLAHAGDLADVSMETIAKAATKADIAFVKAAQGSATARDAFKGVGLSMDDLQGKTAADRFSTIADAIAGLPTEAERAAASVKLFGKAGAELLPLFAEGSGAIKEATAEAQRFGLALTGAQGRDVEAMNDSFTKVQKAIGGIVQQVVASLAPSITAVAETFTNFVGSVGGANIGQAIGDGILAGARFLAGVADSFIGGLSAVWKYVSGVAGIWSNVFEYGSRFGSFLAGVGRGLVGVFQGFLAGATGLLGLVSKTAKQMSEGFAQGADKNFAAAGENFAAAFGPGGAVADATAGPIAAALDAAIGRAKAAAGQIDVASKQTVGNRGADLAARMQSVKAVDSRSKEGIAEMFRLMRGGENDAAERTADATERMADELENMGVDVTELNFAW